MLFSGNDVLYEMQCELPWYYRCSKTFQLELLVKSLEPHDIVGVVSMDLSDCGFGIIDRNNLTVLKTITSGIQSKHRAGGQSAGRFERLRRGHKREFYNRIIEYVEKFYLGKNFEKIYISGPAFTKGEFYDLCKKKLNYQIKDKLEIIDGCSYAGEDGLYEASNFLR